MPSVKCAISLAKLESKELPGLLHPRNLDRASIHNLAVQKETKEIVVERIRAEEVAARGAREGPKELGDIHTDDEEDEEAEYELWRQRELRRIRRYSRPYTPTRSP